MEDSLISLINCSQFAHMKDKAFPSTAAQFHLTASLGKTMRTVSKNKTTRKKFNHSCRCYLSGDASLNHETSNLWETHSKTAGYPSCKTAPAHLPPARDTKTWKLTGWQGSQMNDGSRKNLQWSLLWGGNRAHPSAEALGVVSEHLCHLTEPWLLPLPSREHNTPSPAQMCQHLPAPAREWLLDRQVLNCGVQTAKAGFCFKSRIFLMFPKQKLWGACSTAATVIWGTMQKAWEIRVLWQTGYSRSPIILPVRKGNLPNLQVQNLKENRSKINISAYKKLLGNIQNCNHPSAAWSTRKLKYWIYYKPLAKHTTV